MLKTTFLKIHYKERFENKAIVSIVVAKQDFHWEEEGEEAIINGKFFDVQSYFVTENYVTLKGWYDHEEDHLNVVATKHHKKEHEKSATIFIQFGYLFCSQFAELLIPKANPSSLKHIAVYCKKPTTCVLDIPTPPPLNFI